MFEPIYGKTLIVPEEDKLLQDTELAAMLQYTRQLFDKRGCKHPDSARELLQTVPGTGWRCTLCGHMEAD